MTDSYEIDLNKRLEYLEEANFFKMMALDLTKELGKFNSSINQLEDPIEIFNNCQERARKIIQFKQVAFFMVNEEDSEFYPYCAFPDKDSRLIEKEMDILVEDGTFSRAVMEKEPVTAYAQDLDNQLLLHVLATASRVRGMFVGILEKNSKHIQEASLELFSILMAHCANALESYELYQQLRESNELLQKKVKQLYQSESCLKDEILEHEKTEAALEASEKQYRLLAETAHEIIMMISDDNKVVYANSSTANRSGYSKGEMVGENLDVFLPDINTEIEEDIQSADLISKTGAKIPVEIDIAHFSNKKAVSDFLIIGRDVSKRNQAEKERKVLEKKLWQAQKMESIGLLASGISHDFSNIVSIIGNYTALSRSNLPEDSLAQTYMQKVQAATDRAIHLARKLHTIGRKDDHTKVIINIVVTINETIDLISSTLGRNVFLRSDCKKSSLSVLAEETRIQQILMNLITNAAQAMVDKKGTIIVSASQVKIEDEAAALPELDVTSGDYIKISVTDDGIGMDDVTLQRIFDPYFSTKKGENNSGLGLSVVHGIVKNYKGAIDVDSQKGQGTSFHIYLPDASA